MKFALSILLTFITLFALGQSKKQQIEELQTKLNQSQLKERSLEEEIKQLNDTLSKYANDKYLLENGILYLENLNSENEKKKNTYAERLNKIQEESASYAVQLNKIQEESASYAVQLYTIQEELKSKKDSIKQLILEQNSITSGNPVSEINKPKSKLNSADFLNNYVLNRQPLNNNTFSFQLAKIITYRGSRHSHEWYAPSIVDIDNFYLRYIPKGKNIQKVSEQTLVSQKPLSFLNRSMPQIEVLKNKLVTIKYQDGSEESLLYNLKSETNTLNEEIRITLASEQVGDSYGNSNSEYDLTWDICQINGEFYIVLSYDDLERLSIPLADSDYKEVEYTDLEYAKTIRYCHLSSLPYDYYGLTKEKMWLTQKKNSFNEKDIKVDPSMCNYLFKLVEN
ncbi:hypothetical protein N9J07_01650 [Bacteroidia bacterium]|nr:hypothetical protein [Bacteroidia bacterium]